jgi:hypothetical protein
VGWTGLAPIALLIENVLGFDIVGKDNLINWNIKRIDRHGIKNIQLGNQKVSLVFQIYDNKPRITIKCEHPFKLHVLYKDKKYSFDISGTDTQLEL